VLSGFEENPFDLIVAKDVFEHIDERELHDVADRLLCIGRQIMAIVPLVDKRGKFIFPLYEKDPTHVTRLTRDEWLGFFPYTVAEDCHELTPKVRRADKVTSTLSCGVPSQILGGSDTLIGQERLAEPQRGAGKAPNLSHRPQG